MDFVSMERQQDGLYQFTPSSTTGWISMPVSWSFWILILKDPPRKFTLTASQPNSSWKMLSWHTEQFIWCITQATKDNPQRFQVRCMAELMHTSFHPDKPGHSHILRVQTHGYTHLWNNNNFLKMQLSTSQCGRGVKLSEWSKGSSGNWRCQFQLLWKKALKPFKCLIWNGNICMQIKAQNLWVKSLPGQRPLSRPQKCNPSTTQEELSTQRCFQEAGGSDQHSCFWAFCKEKGWNSM